VSFVYASNVKENSGSLRNLSFKVEPCTSPIFLVIIICDICDLSRNISVVPNPQFPLNTGHQVFSRAGQLSEVNLDPDAKTGLLVVLRTGIQG
jgi:hypothetical protein